ncbi:kinesin-like protein KIN-14J isoform X2 [Papaver somniferum]|uniref:kinesin-like protein KIN-14J isoform X2 n=1 Tax=Papaver somniferum TaxID=3469 RepID=UPI000E6F5FF5|nr:kinesin-like protein KIN-14J isoform X2 [Papaver somniferum]
MKLMEYFNILPVEITLDIFKRLPIETLIECKLVSKTWKNLIHDPNFTVMHFFRIFDSNHLIEMVHKLNALKEISEHEFEKWYKTEEAYQNFMDFHFQLLQELRQTSTSMQHVVNVMETNGREFTDLVLKFKNIESKAKDSCRICAKESRKMFMQNCRLYNEFLDSKGNVRVYCRVQPCLDKNRTIIQLIGEDGELVIADPSIHTDDGHRSFKFNKVYDQPATEEEVFLDTQPVIRSVVDGYNVCIFSFGQSGWEKTNTKTGLDASSTEDWGIHFEALNVLFQMSWNRRSSFSYKIDVQMVEIYNEQVRDLLQTGGSNKICTSSQPNGLTVPDASMHSVESVSDVLKFIRIGLAKQARGLTAINERSIRSHSILAVHVQCTDLVTEAILRGSLHLVDLARSGSIDCSQVTRGRLREAQYINKSLSSLGDVMFSLSRKNDHVPYTDSQLTRVLQRSLGGQGKTAMFVQLNPAVDAYSETLSTLKFAERFSGVDLGSAET